jgi:general secretion pathway protein C
MQWNPTEKWAARIAAFATALLLGASAVVWFLQWPAPAGAGVPALAQSPAPTPDAVALAGLLGSGLAPAPSAAPLESASRFSLIGVVARSSGQGSALISVDGLPPKSYRVGGTVAEGVVLHSVAPRKAMLANRVNGTITQTLEMPVPAASR